jgi:hypothetical protein
VNIDGGSGCRYRDGFRDGARLELCVDAGGERARDLDPFPQVRTEALSYERDGVNAGPKILDAVLAAAIRDNGTDFFNQRGTLGLDGDTRKCAARRVMHNASNHLCECPAGNARSHREE